MPRGDDDQHTAYIGKELDRESELGDHGVRKVDYELGRFTTIELVAAFLLAPYSIIFT